MGNQLIIDSGAFSVWNRGDTIDFDQYIQFCRDNPGVSYYVCLDVIPGKPNDARSLNPASIEASCQQSWKNYMKMLKTLPEEKVIPVFHQGDSFKWLEKYLDFGTPYLGISPANDRTTEQRYVWLEEAKKYILDSHGKLVTKTHGFAVTSLRLMATGLFYSVDSASWLRLASYGKIMVPFYVKGVPRFDKTHWCLTVSPKNPDVDVPGMHIQNVSPLVRESATKWVESIGLKIGTYEVVPAEDKKPDGKKGEVWWSKKKDKILKPVERGVVTCRHQRLFANMRWLHRAEKVLPVEHIYFAGSTAAIHPQIEKRLRNRLLSYVDILSTRQAREALDWYVSTIQEEEKCVSVAKTA